MLTAHVGSIVATQDTGDITDDTGANGFNGIADAIIGVTLVSHLRDDVVAQP